MPSVCPWFSKKVHGASFYTPRRFEVVSHGTALFCLVGIVRVGGLSLFWAIPVLPIVWVKKC